MPSAQRMRGRTALSAVGVLVLIFFALLFFSPKYRWRQLRHERVGYESHETRAGVPGRVDRLISSTCTVAHVVDGDTLDCKEGDRVRLLLIDAPELDQGSLGEEATKHLASLAPPGAVLRLEFDRERHDEHGRLLAYAWLHDGRMINEEMVRDGYAITFSIRPNIKYRDRMRAAKREAKARRAGLWAMDGFTCPPVAFRHGRCR